MIHPSFGCGDAIALFQDSLAIVRPIAEANPTVHTYQESLVTDLANLAMLQGHLGLSDPATKTLSEAAERSRELVADNPDVPRFRKHLASICEAAAESAVAEGDTAAAKEHYCEALIASDERWRSTPDTLVIDFSAATRIADSWGSTNALDAEDTAVRRKGAVLLNNLAMQYLDADELANASESLNAILTIYGRLPNPRDLASEDIDLIARAIGNLGWIDLLEQRYDAAIDKSERALQIDPRHVAQPNRPLVLDRVRFLYSRQLNHVATSQEATPAGS